MHYVLQNQIWLINQIIIRISVPYIPKKPHSLKSSIPLSFLLNLIFNQYFLRVVTYNNLISLIALLLLFYEREN